MSNPTASVAPVVAAKELLDAVWRQIGGAFSATGGFPFPKRVFWLNGAPGAGKGTHTPVIQRHLGVEAAPVVTSDLLKSPQARALIDAGKLVGDSEVAALLLEKLAEPCYREGVIVDGFPRTAVQAEFLRLLHHRLAGLARDSGGRFAAPEFRVGTLLVDEDESARRQLQRGREAAAAGQGARKTDTDEELARRRHRIFMAETVEPLRALRGHFPYHEINTTGEKPEVAARIAGALAKGVSPR
ncbi:MAG: nucleoside monophosphate kinase [Puniceicoccales bacterium]|jgi:adenylate kinase|nr:nucleoside monophosphate kinase [Puniceicoccales bacterium]